MRLNLICKTPRRASRKIFMLILDVPNSRSTKRMGTSLIWKPLRLARSFISIWKAYPMNAQNPIESFQGRLADNTQNQLLRRARPIPT